MNRESIRDILDVRRNTHGDFEEQANLWHDLFETCMATSNWYELTADQQHALVFILTKISRLLVGNHNEPDHWRDIAGYATLVADRLGPKPDLLQTDVTKNVTTYVHVKDKPAQYAPSQQLKSSPLVPRRVPVPAALNSIPPWVILGDPNEHWYSSLGNGYYVLEPWVAHKGDGDEPPPDLNGYYTYQAFPDTQGWLLKIEYCPEIIRDHWPVFRGHVNATEHEELLSWERGLYAWIGSNSHFGLKNQHQAWRIED
jgi:hypothetical protein